ncbi:ssDNA endonuclease and repair protein rad10 [Entomortierella chlamydospora]|uniref:DNA excision repair protein ERCC-1 n=1 Tax=Entomortierella chlamydospora TaxID=101097 RepID=A0A9P6MKZ9_9FUNG|nr:ssDNA endonuclease and repair protein rad10 [Entomortierella chlamydospora]KAG0006784.1 ssDNA endonuclease and repair protein rad10 [Entomortierella chlamydospora]
MEAGPNNGDINGGTKSTKPFKVPSRAEVEERRKQLEANKPTLHFNPKGIAGANSRLPTNATNLTATVKSPSQNNTTTKDVNPLKRDNPIATNDTQAAVTSSQAGTSAPTIVSSRQHYQQQREPSQKPQNSQSLDDDFGFGDDLGDVILDDDFFDMDDNSPSKVQKPTNPPTQPINASASSSSSAGATPTSAATSTTTDPATTPVVPPPFVPKSKSTVVVKPSQRGNPMLQFIRNVPYEYGDIVPDFIVGLTSCILFLSIRYHRLHPEYIFSRIAALGKTFVLRILLVLVDVDTHQQAIRELTRVAILNDLTIVCAWSNEEAARYIETYKAYENKAPDAIKERVDNDYLSKLTDCLTQIQSINKTDVVTLSSTFGSFRNIMNASVDELGILPGFGERKVRRLLEAFDQPFAVDPKKRKQRRR